LKWKKIDQVKWVKWKSCESKSFEKKSQKSNVQQLETNKNWKEKPFVMSRQFVYEIEWRYKAF